MTVTGHFEVADHNAGRFARGNNGIGVAFLAQINRDRAQPPVDGAGDRGGARRTVAFALRHSRRVAGAGHDEHRILLLDMVNEAFGRARRERLSLHLLARGVVQWNDNPMGHAPVFHLHRDQAVRCFTDDIWHECNPSR